MIGTHQLIHVYKDLTRVRHVFLLHFRDLRRFYFLDIQKLKYAAAYFAYTQARPCTSLIRNNESVIINEYAALLDVDQMYSKLTL